MGQYWCLFSLLSSFLKPIGYYRYDPTKLKITDLQEMYFHKRTALKCGH